MPPEAAPGAAPEASLRKRYVAKLGSNLLGLVISLATQTVIPRSLGPVAYGNFGFLFDFFTQVFNFVDGGASTAFYTKISQRPQESSLVRFYWGYVALTGVIVALLMGGILALGWQGWAWPGQAMPYVWLAAGMAFLVVVRNSINYIIDAHGQTVGGEMWRAVQSVVGMGLVLSLYAFHGLKLGGFFVYNYEIMIFGCLLWWRVLARRGIALMPPTPLKREEIRTYSREFYAYAAPIAAAAVVGLVVGLLDRWVLQKVAGSLQQGFFVLASQIGVICFLFTGAVTPLMIRELSRAAHNQDLPQMQSVFGRLVPMFYAISAYFSVFAAVKAESVALIFGGDEFRKAATAVSIMAVFPMWQTYGQLCGALLFATGYTRFYGKMCIMLAPLSVLMTFVLLAPRRWWGLDLQATGLALKTVGLTILVVQIELVVCARILKLRYARFAWHQIFCPVVFAALALLSSKVVEWALGANLASFIISGMVYTLGVVGATFVLPALFGTTRGEIFHTIDVGHRWVRSLLAPPATPAA